MVVITYGGPLHSCGPMSASLWLQEVRATGELRGYFFGAPVRSKGRLAAGAVVHRCLAVCLILDRLGAILGHFVQQPGDQVLGERFHQEIVQQA